MQFTHSLTFLILATLGLTACDKQPPPAPPVVEQPNFQIIAAKIPVGEKTVDSVVEWNTKTGEARLLSSAVVTDKANGQSAPVIGWVGLQDFQQSFQNAASRLQAQQAKSAASPDATSSPASLKPKHDD